jgi:ABC-type multidrug transport system fused ATPase/permease subunit
LRLDIISSLIILSVAVIAVVMHDKSFPINPNIVGLALIYSLQLSGLLQWTVRIMIDTENNMVAVERLNSLRFINSEASKKTEYDDGTSGEQWPNRGALSIKNLRLRYRPELELVIKGIDIEVVAGSRLGICGRTGSGKSSLMQAIFRIVEPEEGSEIHIDGVDILRLGLDKLRSNLTSKYI